MIKSLESRQVEIQRAKRIAKSLGTFTAARYLCKREWSMEAAMYIILGK